MEYRQLGTTNFKVSAIGFGCWAIGGHGYGEVDDQESIRAIHKAIDLGINFFDTADVYGFGHSEEILTLALGNRKKDVILATKFGVAWDETGKTWKDCSPQRAIQALEGSLRRLKIDCIPLYQIHWYDNKTPIDKTMEVLKRCQEQGKIRYISCSNFSVDLICRASKIQRIESLQRLYNIIQKEAKEEMIECYEKFRMGIIAYGPLARGFLTGEYNENTEFGEKDTRKSSKIFQEEQLRKNGRVLEKLKKIAASHGKSSAQAAIRYVLDSPCVTCVLTGHKTAQQVEENTGAFGWKLTSEDFQFLESN